MKINKEQREHMTHIFWKMVNNYVNEEIDKINKLELKFTAKAPIDFRISPCTHRRTAYIGIDQIPSLEDILKLPIPAATRTKLIHINSESQRIATLQKKAAEIQDRFITQLLFIEGGADIIQATMDDLMKELKK